MEKCGQFVFTISKKIACKQGVHKPFNVSIFKKMRSETALI